MRQVQPRWPCCRTAVLHRARRPGYMTEEVNSSMIAVNIWVTAWLILSGFQGLAKNTVESSQNSDMDIKSWPVYVEFQLNDGREWLFGTLKSKWILRLFYLYSQSRFRHSTTWDCWCWCCCLQALGGWAYDAPPRSFLPVIKRAPFRGPFFILVVTSQ